MEQRTGKMSKGVIKVIKMDEVEKPRYTNAH